MAAPEGSRDGTRLPTDFSAEEPSPLTPRMETQTQKDVPARQSGVSPCARPLVLVRTQLRL